MIFWKILGLILDLVWEPLGMFLGKVFVSLFCVGLETILGGILGGLWFPKGIFSECADRVNSLVATVLLRVGSKNGSRSKHQKGSRKNIAF